MSLRLGIACSVTAALGLAAWETSSAKPPDLPDKPQVTCQEGVISGKSAQDPPPTTLAEPACPYLKRQAEAEKVGSTPASPKPGSVLENLDKLEKVQKLYREAEFYQQSGHLGSACFYFEKVRLLCPGSRYAGMAEHQLSELHARGVHETTPPVAEEEEELPPPGKNSDHHSLLLSPDLPPVDPKVVEALEKILAETGDPETAKLILTNNEPAQAEVRELDPALGWAPPPVEQAIPSLFLLPEPPPPDPVEEESAQEEPATDSQMADLFVPDLNDLLREAVEMLGAGAGTEIDTSNLHRLRVQCEKQIGGVLVRVVSDDDNVFQCVVVSLVPEARGDLRAAQRAHNEHILKWIEAITNGVTEEIPDTEDDWDVTLLEEEPWFPESP